MKGSLGSLLVQSIILLLQANTIWAWTGLWPNWAPNWHPANWTPDYQQPNSTKTEPDYVLVATGQNITVGCQSRYSVVFNGTSPGPTLHMKEGERTWIRVYNDIEAQNLTVHWHGLSQRADVFSDGSLISQWPIAPGQFFDYAVMPMPGDAGSYFYHSHVGVQAITAAGALIVDDAGKPPYHWDQDIPILMTDYYQQEDEQMLDGLWAPKFKWSGESSGWAFNGHTGNQSWSKAPDASCSPMVIDVVPGQITRLRFISGAFLSYSFIGIEDHPNLTIIEAGGEYTKPWNTSHLQLASGQRFSVLFQALDAKSLRKLGKTGFWLRYETRQRPVTTAGYAYIRYRLLDEWVADLPLSLPASSPVQLTSDIAEIAAWSESSFESYNTTVASNFPRLSEVTRTITITEKQVGPWNGSWIGTIQWAQNNLPWLEDSATDNNTVPYLIQVYTENAVPDYQKSINNGGWDPDSARHAWPALVGETLDIVWQSNNGPAGGYDFHPFHAHGEHFYDLGSGNGTYDAQVNERKFEGYTPARRDTTVLHRYRNSAAPNTTMGWRAWRIRVTEDNVGAWMYHCHILPHLAMGMVSNMVFGTAEEIRAKFPAPEFVQGYLNFGGDAVGNSSYDPFVDGIYHA